MKTLEYEHESKILVLLTCKEHDIGLVLSPRPFSPGWHLLIGEYKRPLQKGLV